MKNKSKKYKWLMFAILMLAGITINISQLKVVPITSDIASTLNVSLTSTAWLTSVFTIAGIVLALPGSGIMTKIGPKRMLVSLLIALMIGNIFGIVGFSINSYPVVLISRIIEGISCALVIPCGLSLVSLWFGDTSSMGLATGLFTIANPVANFVVMNVSLPITNIAHSVVGCWWFVLVLTAISLLGAIFLVDDGTTGREGQSASSSQKISIMDATIHNKPLIVMCVAMFFLAYCLMGIVTNYPTIFTTAHGLDQSTANFYTSLNGLVGIPAAIIIGSIIGKTGKPFSVALVGALGTLCVDIGLIFLGPSTYLINVICASVFTGGCAVTAFFEITPQLALRKEYVPLASGALNTFYYLGIFLSTPSLVALSSDGSNWTIPALVMACSAVILFCLTIVARKLAKNIDIH
jgi:predicted MFS family arabinose efflux permease